MAGLPCASMPASELGNPKLGPAFNTCIPPRDLSCLFSFWFIVDTLSQTDQKKTLASICRKDLEQDDNNVNDDNDDDDDNDCNDDGDGDDYNIMYFLPIEVVFDKTTNTSGDLGLESLNQVSPP